MNESSRRILASQTHRKMSDPITFAKRPTPFPVVVRVKEIEK